MRIIGEIEHSKFKISLFKSGEKTILQIENGQLEQLYKFRDGEIVYDIDSAKSFLNERFLSGLQEVFDKMKSLKSENVSELISSNEIKFPEII